MDRVEVAVVGAGLAGLTCARQLQDAGVSVVVLEKSRGLGGRLATRRLADTWADHGVRYLEPQGQYTQHLLATFSDTILHRWTASMQAIAPDGSRTALNTPRYVANSGITAVAKALADGLEIQRGQRVGAIAPSDGGWTLTCESVGEPSAITQHQATFLVLTIPAPQALALVKPLAIHPEFQPTIQELQKVTFDPCITAIAAYSNLGVSQAAALHFAQHPTLSWVSLESSKQNGQADQAATAVIVQSSPSFAATYFEAPDLMPVGQTLLTKASTYLGASLSSPQVLQVHRWRYAFCRIPYPHPYLENGRSRFICGGDWCGGSRVEQALKSGQAVADAVLRTLGEVGE